MDYSESSCLLSASISTCCCNHYDCSLCIGKTYKAPYILVYYHILLLIMILYLANNIDIYWFFVVHLDNFFDNNLLWPQLIYKKSCQLNGITWIIDLQSCLLNGIAWKIDLQSCLLDGIAWMIDLQHYLLNGTARIIDLQRCTIDLQGCLLNGIAWITVIAKWPQQNIACAINRMG